MSPEMSLRGRATELDELTETLGLINDGLPAVVEVSGAAGIGKTSLLSVFAERARAEGVDACWGRAAEFERELPFGVWADALASVLPERGFDGARAEQSPAGSPSGLERLAEQSGHLVLVADERYRLHRVVRSTLESMAEHRPALVILDDLHWADSASVDLVASLLRHPPGAGVMLALAFRSGQIPKRLEAALAAADRAGVLTRLALLPLGRDDSMELLGDDISASRRELLFHQSGGNPFLLQQLARGRSSLVSHGLPGSGTINAPVAVVELLADEITTLDAIGQRVLQGAAVAGDPFDPTLAAVAAGIDDSAVFDVLDVLVAGGFVHPGSTPDRFSFRHPLVRSAVYETAGPGWRIGAHGRVATELALRGERPSVRAHHVMCSAPKGSQSAANVLAEAAADVAVSSPASAARWLGAALNLLDGIDGSDLVRVELLVARAKALAAVGELGESRQAYLDAASATAVSDVSGQVRLAVSAAGVETLLGRHEEAARRLRAAYDRLEDRSSAEALSLLVEMAACAFHGRDFEATSGWAERGLHLADIRGDDVHAAVAHGWLGLRFALLDGRLAIPHVEAAVALVDTLTDDELEERVDVFYVLSFCGLYLERFAFGADMAARGIELCRRSGQGQVIPLLSVSEGSCRVLLGDVKAAAAVLSDACEAARLVDNPYTLGWVLYNIAYVDLLSGQWNNARNAARESVDLMDRVDDAVAVPYCRAQLAMIALDEGDADTAATQLIDAGGGPDLPLIFGFWRCYLLEALARAQLARGHQDEARAAAKAASAHASVINLPLAAGVAERARAAMLLDDGDPGAAAEVAGHSAELAQRSDSEIESARSTLLRARALAAAGRRQEAIVDAGRAVDVLTRCGAAVYADEATTFLRRASKQRVVPGQANAPGLASLSAREREVADLIVDRHTNREIANLLLLSPKTVESHVRHILAKLRLTDRKEIARLIELERGAA